MNANQQAYPLAFTQKRIWSLQQEGHSLRVRAQLAINGPIDPFRLQQAFERVAKSNEVLRTVYPATTALIFPRQVVSEKAVISFTTRDISHLSANQQECIVLDCKGLTPPLPTTDPAPALTVVLLTLAPDEHQLLLSVPALVADATSVRVLVDQVLDLYWNEANPEPPVLPYCQFAEWVNGLVAEPEPVDVQTWQHYALPQTAGHPFGWAKPGGTPQITAFPTRRQARLSAPLVTALRSYAGRLQLDLSALMLAYWQVVIQRHLGNERVVTGVVFNQRVYDELKTLVGRVANPVPVVSEITPMMRFPDLAKQLKLSLNQAINWPESFAWPHAGTYDVSAAQPYFGCGYEWIDQTVGVEAPTGTSVRYVDFADQSDRFGVQLCIRETNDALALDLYFDAADFSEAAQKTLTNQLLAALEHAHTQESLLVSALPLQTPAARQQALAPAPTNDPDQLCPTLMELFEAQATARPDAIALQTDTTQLTYRALHERVTQLANYLTEHYQVAPGQLIGLMAYRSEWAIIGLLGILKTGAAYVPIDPDYPGERVALLVQESQPDVLLVEDMALCHRHSLKHNTLVPLVERWAEIEATNLTTQPRTYQPTDLAYVMYTSGSTGVPKGVEISVESLTHYLTWANAYYVDNQPEGPFGLFTSLSFDLSVTGLFGTLLRGATLRLYGHQASISETLEAVFGENSPIRYTKMTPSHVRLLTHLPLQKTPIQGVIVGGEALLPDHVATLRRLNPAMRIFNEYGPTETTVGCTVQEISDELAPITVGRPITNTQVLILDNAGIPVPVGVVGELFVGGLGLAQGYRKRPDLTNEKFGVHPLAGHRLYRTGDLGRWLPNGEIDYLGRSDNQLKIRGFRIEPSEIEYVLLQFERVQEAVVVCWREPEPCLVGYWVGAATDERALRTHLEQHLPAHMVPAYLVKLPRLPQTVNGKIDTKALPDPRLSRRAGSVYVAPRNDLERQLAEVIGGLLQQNDVGIDDHLFDMGIDSIKAIQIASQLHRAGLKIEVRDLLRHPRISELTAFIKTETTQSSQAVVTGRVPLAPAQAHFLSSDRLAPHHYNQSVVLHLREPLSANVVQTVFSTLTTHHDALRMVFRLENVEMVQECLPPGQALDPLVWDFREEAEPEKAFATQANTLQRSFDLATGPLLTIALANMPDGQRLLIVMHHLVVDGVSWRVLLDDLSDLFNHKPLPPKTDSFGQWTNALIEFANSPQLLAEKAYWQSIGSWFNTSLPRPTTNHRQQDQRTRTFRLDAERSRQLARANAAFGTNTQDLLLTALSLALHQTIGSDPVWVMLESHGRDARLSDSNTHRTVGWFTSEFPVVLPVDSVQPIDQQLVVIKEILRAVPGEGIGYRLLQQYHTRHDQPDDTIFYEQPALRFNYLGSFQSDQPERPFRFADEWAGDPRDPREALEYTLELIGYEDQTGLSMAVVYHPDLTSNALIDELWGACETALNALIDTCIAQTNPRLTPSDITCRGLSMAALDELGRTYEFTDVLPLTPAQEGMLLYSLLNPQSPVYFQQLHYVSEGAWEATLVRDSLNHLLTRHEGLRTAFLHLHTQAVQVIRRQIEADFYYEDLQFLSESDQQKYLNQYGQRDIARLFQLDRDVLMRVALFKLDEQRFAFFWSNHHIVLDGWSMSILTIEFQHIYSQLLRKQDVALPNHQPLHRFANWLDQQDLAGARAYWHQYLADYEGGLTLPFVPADNQPDAPLSQRWLQLDAATTKQLEQLATDRAVTLNTLVNTLWGVLLAWYGNRRDVVFGALMAGRPADVPGIDAMVGMFINTVPVRVRYEPETTFSDLLTMVQDEAHRTERMQHLWDGQTGQAGQPNLLNHLLILENYPTPDDLLPTGTDPGLPAPTDAGEFDRNTYPFTVLVARKTTRVNGQNEASLHIRFDYQVQEGMDETIAQLTERLQRLIEEVIGLPNQPLDAINWLSSSENQQVIHGFNQTQRPIQPGLTVCSLFEHQAATQPNAIALSNGHHQLTYRALNEASNQLAHHLRGQYGIGPGQVVGVLLDRSEHPIIALWAILKAGGTYLPLDPAHPREHTRFCLTDAGATVLITDSERVFDVIDYYGGQLFAIDAQLADLSEPTTNPTPNFTTEDLAYIIYTSGSTGQPKGTLIEHRSLVNFALGKIEGVGLLPADVVYQFASPSFDASLSEIMLTLCGGATLALTTDAIIRNRTDFLAHLHQTQTTVIILTPAYLGLFSADELRHLRVLLTVGDAADTRLTTELSRHVRVLNAYGPTEGTICATMFTVLPDGLPATHVPIGQPMPNVQTYVLDRAGRPLPVGMPGELCLGGMGLARGYLNRPDLTASRFRPNPFGRGFLYHTGDVARWLPDGNLVYLGRLDRQIKVRGQRVEQAEIENRLVALSGGQAVVQVGHLANGTEQLLAFVTGSHDPVRLRQQLAEQLPAFMVPDAIVPVDTLPLTISGKVDTAKLLAHWHTNRTIEPAGRQPETDTQSKLAAIWETVLDRTGLRLDDNFFEVGGHSLKAIQVLWRMECEWQTTFTIKVLFTNPTLESLARYVEQSHSTGAVSGAIPVLAEQFDYACTSAQQRLWMLQQLQPDLTAYNMPLAYELTGPLNVDALNYAYQTMISRHESLRTTFVAVDGEPRQRISAPNPARFVMEQVDLAGDTSPEQLAHQLAEQEAILQFDLAAGPLVRSRLLRLSANRHVLLLTMHHIVTDEWSLEVIFSELTTGYNRYGLANEAPTEPLRVQYVDYAAWQQETLRQTLPQLRTYWLDQFAQPTPPLALPTDYPRPMHRTYAGQHVEEYVVTDQFRALQELGQQHQASLFMVLLTAVNGLLYRYANGQPVTVGTPISGRTHPDLGDQIGFYVNTLAIRNQFSPNQLLSEMLKLVRQQTLEAYDHQLFPFEELVNSVGGPRDASRNPLFDVWVVLHNAPASTAPMHDVTIGRFGPPTSAIHFDLSFDFVEEGDRLLVALRYNHALFSAERAHFLLESLLGLLTSMTRQPDATLIEWLAQPMAEHAPEVLDLTLELNY